MLDFVEQSNISIIVINCFFFLKIFLFIHEFISSSFNPYSTKMFVFFLTTSCSSFHIFQRSTWSISWFVCFVNPFFLKMETFFQGPTKEMNLCQTIQNTLDITLGNDNTASKAYSFYFYLFIRNVYFSCIRWRCCVRWCFPVYNRITSKIWLENFYFFLFLSIILMLRCWSCI